ncbi:uncharacterized protein LOC129747953 [Uranotaenia lowii]|uniref:uncharacterized protein LOC129747953 n=1 Tax=Uranotaenia lowii TaxID=190385 RepID=UPI0024794545|nr:uncharacterized protein LOC129747953 [Uranotaenia lowii]
MEGFDYVIQRPPQPKLCFGSTITREAAPLEGPAQSNIMRATMPELLAPELAPGSYNISYFSKVSHPALNAGIYSKRGFGPMASPSPRFKTDEVVIGPSIGEYDAYKTKPLKPSVKPFGSSISRWQEKPKLAVPGPGTYIAKQRKDIKRHSFGSHIKVIPATRTLCKPENFDTCQCCAKKPEVDYWKNLKTERVLCRACMEKEVDDAIRHSRTKSVMMSRLAALREFRRVRHCSYYHRHDKTTAAVQFVSNRDLKRKFHIENYLSMFE